MPDFQFTARDASGSTVRGVRKARSAEDLAMQLQKESLMPLDIEQATKAKIQAAQPAAKSSGLFKKQVAKEELQMFCRQMYTLIKSGIPLAIAIARLAESTHDKELAKTLQQILVGLNEGQSLHASMRRFPKVFSDFFINLVKLGEEIGKLDEVFYHLSEYMLLEIETGKKLKKAMRYPLIVSFVTFCAVIGVTVFVIPAFAKMFESFHAELPLPTLILVYVANFFINYWYVVLIGLIALIYGFRYYIKTPDGAIAWSKWQLKIPIFGWLIHRIILSRFTRLFALVLRAGLSAVEGINLVGKSTNNAYFAAKIQSVTQSIGRGNTIATSLAQTKLFPPLVLQMISLGEETGRIDELLNDAADFYQRDIEYDLARFNDYIEPIMIVIVAGMVLILALGVYMPMWDFAGKALKR
ncbi:type II secretion system F family protein [Legionella impletisoli]|uniref:MSHA biogenesis protein MshG n=1 Tax=Legionella impletisoli TaxID=343510 RepID=A0A917JWD0_9GAMM|nr:type II secretion system F family protein [Legionella impletisoli]GGI86935.1 MSHA biogenesis protein MshG [Legionella impletisoli]